MFDLLIVCLALTAAPDSGRGAPSKFQMPEIEVKAEARPLLPVSGWKNDDDDQPLPPLPRTMRRMLEHSIRSLACLADERGKVAKSRMPRGESDRHPSPQVELSDGLAYRVTGHSSFPNDSTLIRIRRRMRTADSGPTNVLVCHGLAAASYVWPESTAARPIRPVRA